MVQQFEIVRGKLTPIGFLAEVLVEFIIFLLLKVFLPYERLPACAIQVITPLSRQKK